MINFIFIHKNIYYFKKSTFYLLFEVQKIYLEDKTKSKSEILKEFSEDLYCTMSFMLSGNLFSHINLSFYDVRYLRSGFEYFLNGFVPKVIPTKPNTVPDRTRRDLSIEHVAFFIRPLHDEKVKLL